MANAVLIRSNGMTVTFTAPDREQACAEVNRMLHDGFYTRDGVVKAFVGDDDGLRELYENTSGTWMLGNRVLA